MPTHEAARESTPAGHFAADTTHDPRAPDTPFGGVLNAYPLQLRLRQGLVQTPPFALCIVGKTYELDSAAKAKDGETSKKRETSMAVIIADRRVTVLTRGFERDFMENMEVPIIHLCFKLCWRNWSDSVYNDEEVFAMVQDNFYLGQPLQIRYDLAVNTAVYLNETLKLTSGAIPMRPNPILPFVRVMQFPKLRHH